MRLLNSSKEAEDHFPMYFHKRINIIIDKPGTGFLILFFDFIECFTTTFLRAHSWLNWVDLALALQRLFNFKIIRNALLDATVMDFHDAFLKERHKKHR